MGSRKKTVSQADDTHSEIRNQEVLRANRELSAYFKGKRTEREARAALKIIKAFIRDREEQDPAARGPLPGAQSSHPSSSRKNKKSTAVAADAERIQKP